MLLASTDTTQLIPALLGGAGTAVIGLFARVLWRWRFGRGEDEKKASESAYTAVQAISIVVDSLREERLTLRDENADLRQQVRRLERPTQTPL